MYVFFQPWGKARTFFSWSIYLNTCFPWRRDSMVLQFSFQTIFSGAELSALGWILYTAYKVSKYGLFLVRNLLYSDWIRRFNPYSINLRIQSEYRKIRTRNNSVFGHFLCSGSNWLSMIFYLQFKMTALAFEKMQKKIVIPW